MVYANLKNDTSEPELIFLGKCLTFIANEQERAPGEDTSSIRPSGRKCFLEEKRVYNLNEAFYKKLVEAITGSPATHFFQPAFVNGRKIYDDHIFSTKYKDRILQVIQRKPGSDRPVLRTRYQKWDGQYDMLVLTLELSDAIKPTLEKIIKAWLVEGEPFEKIRAMAPQPTYKTAGPAPMVNDDGE